MQNQQRPSRLLAQVRLLKGAARVCCKEFLAEVRDHHAKSKAAVTAFWIFLLLTGCLYFVHKGFLWGLLPTCWSFFRAVGCHLVVQRKVQQYTDMVLVVGILVRMEKFGATPKGLRLVKRLYNSAAGLPVGEEVVSDGLKRYA